MAGDRRRGRCSGGADTGPDRAIHAAVHGGGGGGLAAWPGGFGLRSRADRRGSGRASAARASGFSWSMQGGIIAESCLSPFFSVPHSHRHTSRTLFKVGQPVGKESSMLNGLLNVNEQ